MKDWPEIYMPVRWVTREEAEQLFPLKVPRPKFNISSPVYSKIDETLRKEILKHIKQHSKDVEEKIVFALTTGQPFAVRRYFENGKIKEEVFDCRDAIIDPSKFRKP